MTQLSMDYYYELLFIRLFLFMYYFILFFLTIKFL